VISLPCISAGRASETKILILIHSKREEVKFYALRDEAEYGFGEWEALVGYSIWVGVHYRSKGERKWTDSIPPKWKLALPRFILSVWTLIWRFGEEDPFNSEWTLPSGETSSSTHSAP
jgi:hypothetical protein